MPKKAPSVKDYLDNIDITALTSGLWDPTRVWNRWHGDGKSTTGGAYHIESMLDSDGVYKAKVVGPKGKTVVEVSFASDTSPAPDFGTVVQALIENA